MQTTPLRAAANSLNVPHPQRRIVRIGAAIVAIGSVLIGAGWLGLVVMLAVELVYGMRGGWRPAIPMIILAASCGLLVAVSPNLTGQIIYALVYVAGAVWLAGHTEGARVWGLAAANQFLSLTAIFVLISMMHIPMVFALMLAWGSAFAVADYVLVRQHDAASGLLAVSWALVVAELTWVLSIWLIHYVLIGGALIVPLPAVVITGFGYAFAGIYFSHLRGKLNRARLFEYLMIGGVFLVFIILGTKWSGG